MWGSEYDEQTERCVHCDGHFRHWPDCPYYQGEPALGLLDRVMLVAAQREADERETEEEG